MSSVSHRGSPGAGPVFGSIPQFNVLDYGAVGDGVTDDTAGIQAAINAATQSEALQAVYLPTGTYKVSAPITSGGSDDSIGGRLIGDSIGRTIITCAFNDSTSPVFRLERADQWTFEHLSFDAESGFSSSSCVEVTDDGPGGTRVQRFAMMHCSLRDTNGRIKRLFHASKTADGGKNDHHLLMNCMAIGYGHSFATLEGQGSVSHSFIHCQALGRSADGSLYGIYAKDDDSTNQGGSFLWLGGQLTQNTLTDFYFEGRQASLAVIKATSETAGRFLQVADPPGGSIGVGRISLIANKWGGTAASIAADAEVIQVYAGGLTVRDNMFGQGVNNIIDMKFRYEPPAAERFGFIFDGNNVITTRTSGWFPATAPDSKVGSYYWTGVNPSAAM